MYRQLARYDETTKSLALRSRRPIHSPTAHRKEELALIQRMLKRNGKYGLAEVYVRCQSQDYQRSFGSMCRQIRQQGYQKRQSYTTYKKETGSYPGEKVQIDIKYVPQSCLRFPSYGKHYYQITAR